MAESHVRIDEGIKRGPRPPRRSKARKVDGTFLPIVSPEQKAQILQDALESLQRGETTDQIGERHQVAGRTIRAWLIGSDEAEQARRYLVASQLARTMDEIRDAQEPLPLARAREEFRSWSWIAERRESRLYAQKQEFKVEVDHRLVVDSALTDRMYELAKRIRGDAAPQLTQGIIDVEQDQSDNQ